VKEVHPEAALKPGVNLVPPAGLVLMGEVPGVQVEQVAPLRQAQAAGLQRFPRRHPFLAGFAPPQSTPSCGGFRCGAEAGSRRLVKAAGSGGFARARAAELRRRQDYSQGRSALLCSTPNGSNLRAYSRPLLPLALDLTLQGRSIHEKPF
jgi:hypothetical protein